MSCKHMLQSHNVRNVIHFKAIIIKGKLRKRNTASNIEFFAGYCSSNDNYRFYLRSNKRYYWPGI
uniref:Uncharacterized protein n=1 Tax=Romanomermis culicivorax TaxID=13658 RepID=A0A915KVY3_ROMCU